MGIHIFSEYDRASALVDNNKDKIYFVPELKSWLIWNGKKFEFDTDKAGITRIAAISNDKLLSDAEKQDINLRITSGSLNKIKNVVKIAETLTQLSLKELDDTDTLFNCNIGTFDLNTEPLKIFRELHSNKDLITKGSPVDYDSKAKYPNWIKFLNRMTGGNKEYMAYLRRVIGYTLSGYANEQCFFVLYGSGNNGKTTFVEIINRLLGDYAVIPPRKIFLKEGRETPSDIATLIGCRMAEINETEQESQLKAANIKRITGNDTLSINLKGQNFEFKNKAKIFWLVNNKPEINETTRAMWRRVHLLPFTVDIPKEEIDIFLFDKLEKELSGILKWAIGGFYDWKSQGLNPPDNILEATKEYKEEMDDISRFIIDDCICEHNIQSLTMDLYEGYEKWCRKNGIPPVSTTKFGTEIKSKGYQAVRLTMGRRGVKGLSCKYAK